MSALNNNLAMCPSLACSVEQGAKFIASLPLSTGGMINNFIATGRWSGEEELYIALSDGGVLPLIDPSKDVAIGRLREGQTVKASGSLCGNVHKDSRDDATPYLVVNELTTLSDGPHKGEGVLDIDAVAWGGYNHRGDPWLFGYDSERSLYQVTMPTIHARWLRKDPSHLVGERLRLKVRAIGETLDCTRVMERTPFARVPAPKLLEPCSNLEAWKEQQAEDPLKRVRAARKISPRTRKEVFLRDGYRCCHCGIGPTDRRNVFLEVDHIIPVARGGTASLDNLQTLCSDCNAGKADDRDPRHVAEGAA